MFIVLLIKRIKYLNCEIYLTQLLWQNKQFKTSVKKDKFIHINFFSVTDTFNKTRSAEIPTLCKSCIFYKLYNYNLF